MLNPFKQYYKPAPHFNCIPFSNSTWINLKHAGIGTKRGAKETPINCRWVNLNCSVIHYLGIFNSYDTDLMEKLNVLDKSKVLKDALNL